MLFKSLSVAVLSGVVAFSALAAQALSPATEQEQEKEQELNGRCMPVPVTPFPAPIPTPGARIPSSPGPAIVPIGEPYRKSIPSPAIIPVKPVCNKCSGKKPSESEEASNQNVASPASQPAIPPSVDPSTGGAALPKHDAILPDAKKEPVNSNTDKLSHLAKKMMLADKDGDDAISLAEYLAPLVKAFDRLDKNKDGAIATDEVGKHAKLIGKYDKNSDGVVALDEFTALAKERFATADVNGDGKLTLAEFANLLSKHA